MEKLSAIEKTDAQAIKIQRNIKRTMVEIEKYHEKIARMENKPHSFDSMVECRLDLDCVVDERTMYEEDMERWRKTKLDVVIDSMGIVDYALKDTLIKFVSWKVYHY